MLSAGVETAGWLETGAEDDSQAGWPYPPHSPLEVDEAGADETGEDSAAVDEAGEDSAGVD